MGFENINDENKIRISFSEKALSTISDDMDRFSVPKTASFINTVIENFAETASSSISFALQRYRAELEQTFREINVTENIKDQFICSLLSQKKDELIACSELLRKQPTPEGSGKLYHINSANIEFLKEDCEESPYYDARPGLYLRTLLEEYCTLPFIERERIYRLPVYEKVELACKNRNIMKVKALYRGQNTTFYVYPYKIVTDSLCTRSYLVCFSGTDRNDVNTVASFSMSRLEMPTVLNAHFFLSKDRINTLENEVSKRSPAYLFGEPEEIHVRLTDRGMSMYKRRFYARPEADHVQTNEKELVFLCPQNQIFDYFFSFGAEAEILSPASLRKRFETRYHNAFDVYNG